MPSSLIISEPEVHMVGNSADYYRVGGYSDIFRATYKQHAVAIKRYRIHEPDNISTYEDVCSPPQSNSHLADEVG
jgi:hypothetical protein